MSAKTATNTPHKTVEQDTLKKGSKVMVIEKEKPNMPDLPSKCTWTRNADPKTSPHTKDPLVPKKKILPNILQAIGQTPMVKLNHIPAAFGIKCEMLGKCEFLNPGGSVKDRIAQRMVEDAEKQGILKPGYTVIEPTSGNTGIGLAMAAAVKGYKCIIVMPEKMSNEKVNTLKSLGAEIVRTPDGVPSDHPDSHLAVADRLQKQLPNAVVLNQYKNPGNPLAHYDRTGEEIYQQCEGKLDMVVMGVGTGGTITGVARRLKELNPNIKVVGVDPEGSIIAESENANSSETEFYEVEGIGYDFIPTVLDRSVIDQWIKTADKESFNMARRLIKEEGLLCGGSSGSAMAAAVRVAKELKEGQRCVVVFPDNIRNYMTKFVSNHWMIARDYIPCENTHNHPWWNDKVSTLKLKEPTSLSVSATCAKTLETMKNQGFHQLPVVNQDGLVGMVTMKELVSALVNGKCTAEDAIEKSLVKKFVTVTPNSTLGFVATVLEVDPFVVVVAHHQADLPATCQVKGEKVIGLITSSDLMSIILNETVPSK